MARFSILAVALAGCMHSSPADIQLGVGSAASLVSTSLQRSVAPPPAIPSSVMSVVPAVPAPPLDGLAEKIDLKTLEAVKVSYVLPLDIGSLARITKTDQAVVLRHMAADPRWRLDEVDGRWVAHQRAESGSRWTVASHGYNVNDAGAWRGTLRFAQLPSNDDWSRSRFVTHTNASAKQVNANAFVLQPPPYHGFVATALSIEGGTASFDVFEASENDDGRPLTSAMTTDLDLYLDGLLRDADTVTSGGYDPMSMPRGEPAISQSVGLQTVGFGEVDVHGRVNPGRPGWTWVRIVNAEGLVWQEQVVAAATREWMGSSPNTTEQFYFQGRVPVPAGPSFEATAEVWFAAFDGGRPERLLASSVRVPAR